MNSYALLIPIYNEEHRLPTLLKQLKNLDQNINIILIDDGSTDGTWNLIKHLKFCKVISNNENIGKGASIKKGLSFVETENVILMDGDAEINLDQIPNIILSYEINKEDILLGTRWVPNVKRNYDINMLGNWIINAFFNFLFKSNFKDILCCLKIMKSSLLRSFDIESKRFTIETEIMARIAQQKISYREVSIKYSRRNKKEGKKIKVSDGFKILFLMLELYISKKSN